MSDYRTDEEQWELVKQWWNRYGKALLLGVLIISAGVMGWRYWQQREHRVAETASIHYQQALTRVQGKPLKTAQAELEALKKQASGTVYATVAALYLAKQYIAVNNFSSAIKELSWALDKAPDASFAQIIRLRLARVYIAQGHPKKALSLLKKIDDNAFVPMILSVEGNAYLALKDKEKARKRYEQALAKMGPETQGRALLEMQYNDLR